MLKFSSEYYMARHFCSYTKKEEIILNQKMQLLTLLKSIRLALFSYWVTALTQDCGTHSQ